jgi:hypothetical protein
MITDRPELELMPAKKGRKLKEIWCVRECVCA